MNDTGTWVNQLFSIRDKYGNVFLSKKLSLLNAIHNEMPVRKKEVQTYHVTLLFLMAYPDDKTVYTRASVSLQQLHAHISAREGLGRSLYNSGITGTRLCAAYSFEMVKWMRSVYKKNIRIRSFESDEGQLQAVLSAVLPKVESEIMQDGNAEWRFWLKQYLKKEEDLLDGLIAVFDESGIRPEVKDELWSAMGINTEIDFTAPCSLPDSLITPCHHRSLLKRKHIRIGRLIHPEKVHLSPEEAGRVIECGRMILVRHLREIDPITFSSAGLVSYYRLPRGFSIALLGMVPERRHPIDSYMGYLVFKNGLPVAYAGSWILFDSARIGLNIFPAYRGGESHYIFEQVLKVHQAVYRLKRFTTDPYQVGKDNSDGIHSGAFWIYYRAGFRPIREVQRKMAEEEAKKINRIKGYRSPAGILNTLAESRLELVLDPKAAGFDATDLSRVYAGILKRQYQHKRKPAEDRAAKKLAALLRFPSHPEGNLLYVLKNWCLLLLANEEALRNNPELKKTLKQLFELKATGSEEGYIRGLQRSATLKKIMQKLVNDFAG